MRKTFLAWFVLSLCACGAMAQRPKAEGPLPVRGIHMLSARPADMPDLERFVRQAASEQGLNLLVLEVDYGYQYKSRTEMADAHGLSEADLKHLAEVCRQAGVKLIPGINLLGHQSWAKSTGALLTRHPEFDETPGKYPNNEGIYCRSYCPLHPQVHDVVFAMMDELLEATGADAFHAGMDEVFLLGEDDCPRCRGKNKAELFAGEVRTLRNHLAMSGRKLWIWGDRLLDGTSTGIGRWSGATNFTAPAIDLIPYDVVICDWHYTEAPPTAGYFAMKGFNVVSAPWRRQDVAFDQLAQIRIARRNSTQVIAARMQGMLHTTWSNAGAFLKAYFGESQSQQAKQAADTFRALFAEMRKEP